MVGPILVFPTIVVLVAGQDTIAGRAVCGYRAVPITSAVVEPVLVTGMSRGGLAVTAVRGCPRAHIIVVVVLSPYLTQQAAVTRLATGSIVPIAVRHYHEVNVA